MQQREGKAPLLVKEIILPHGHDRSGSRKDSTFLSNNDKMITEVGQGITGHRKIGHHEEDEALSLMDLQEKPLENYFDGTRKGKKIRKRKMKHHKILIPPIELFSEGAQTLSKGERKQTEKGLTKEEKTEIQLLDLKIYEYEKMREKALKKNSVRQKMAEEDYICQLESLAVKWFQTAKRRHAAKTVDDDLALPKSHPQEIPNKRTTKKTSFTCRQCCSENSGVDMSLFSVSRQPHSEIQKYFTESPPGMSKKVFKEMCQSVQAQPTDNVLGDEFYEKLVFVDEDSDEFDCDHQNLRFRRSLRKH